MDLYTLFNIFILYNIYLKHLEHFWSALLDGDSLKDTNGPSTEYPRIIDVDADDGAAKVGVHVLYLDGA